MDNPEKQATQGTQDENKQSKNTTQCVLYATIRKQTQITSLSNVGIQTRISYFLIFIFATMI
jgi:hypothetical protein